MPTNRFERGAVVRCKNRDWIVWAYPRGQRHADPLVLPITAQTGPRHRSQMRVDYGGKAMLVHLLDPVTLVGRECAPIGQCDDDMISAIASSMRRAIEANQTEGFAREPV
jgi:hypothetical protein